MQDIPEIEDGEIITDDGRKSNTTRNIIIAVGIVLILLCFCCTFLGIIFTFVGDAGDGIMRELGVFFTAPNPMLYLA